MGDETERSRARVGASGGSALHAGFRWARVSLGLALVAAPLACATASSRVDLDAWRARDMARIEALPASARARALQLRIQRDASEARNWGATDDLETIEDGYQLAAVRFWAVAVENIARTYVKVGDAYREAHDEHSAIAAYEAAIHQADTLVLSAVAAAEIRADAMRGEEVLWRDAGETERAAAAGMLATAQERWLDTDEARDALKSYRQLLVDSQHAAEDIAAAQNARNSAAWGDALQNMGNAMDQQAKAYQQQGAGGATQAQIASNAAQAARTLSAVFSGGANVSAGRFDVSALGGLFDQFPTVQRAIESGGVDRLLDDPSARDQLERLMRSLADLRRGATVAVPPSKPASPPPAPVVAPPPAPVVAPPPAPVVAPPPPPVVAPPPPPDPNAERDAKVAAILARGRAGELSRTEIVDELRAANAPPALILKAVELSELVALGALDITGFHAQLRSAAEPGGAK